jgi:hypothetical protein
MSETMLNFKLLYVFMLFNKRVHTSLLQNVVFRLCLVCQIVSYAVYKRLSQAGLLMLSSVSLCT